MVNASPPPKRGELQLKGLAREAALLAAREWRIAMKPHFDALDDAGAFADSVNRYRRRK